MIVGTAGHIDHGKTTLVRALTGVDTDRLPEEKRRGISIELGYAFVPTPDGEPIGLVDVPGHERLVHTMLAGAIGIDAVLLLVAADDGVMPQTREHLAIASLLGIRSGAVVLTKCDRVPPARIDEVRSQVAELVRASTLAQAPIFPTAAPHGQGIEALRQWLIELAGHSVPANEIDQAFRLAVDRVFTLAGVGTVVTGSVFAGTVAAGDPVQIVPGERQARVRSVHAQNRPSRTACAGQRCALNLAGADRSDIERGQWICDPRAALATARLDAQLAVWHGQERTLRSGDHVHVHIGAADVMARVTALQSDRLAPGSSGYVHLALRRPIAAWRGDRVVLRDSSATHTIAGGQVVDPWPPARYRKTPDRLAMLAALEQADPERRLEATLQAAPWGLALRDLQRGWALTRIESNLPANVVRVGAGDDAFVFSAPNWEAVQRQLLVALAQQHADEPDSIGVEIGRLKRIALPRAEPRVADRVIDQLVVAGRVVRCGGFLQLPEHAVRLSRQEEQLAQKMLPLLEAGGSDPPWVRDLAHDLKQPEALVRATLARQAQRGEVFQVVKDLYLHRAAVDRLAATARNLAGHGGCVQAAQFRDATGLGRKRAIQVLEFFDRVGLLRRVGDAHLVRPGTHLFEQQRTTS